MKLPAHLLLALTLAAPVAALADGIAPTLAETPAVDVTPAESMIPELTEQLVMPENIHPVDTLNGLLETLNIVEVEPEHDPDWCPPCGRG